MALLDAGGQRGRINREAVIHRHDLDLAGGHVLDRMVCAVMALRHFHRPGAQCEGEKLVAEADAEDRRAAGDHVADHVSRPQDRCRRVAGTIREHHAIGLEGGDLGVSCVTVHDGRARADTGQVAQDVLLHAEIDNDDMVFGVIERAIAAAGLPQLLGIAVIGFAIDIGGKIGIVEALPGTGPGDQRLGVDAAFGLVADRGFLHAAFADEAGQRARIDAGQADNPARREPGVEMAGRAPVRRCRNGFAEDRAARSPGAGRRGFFLVVGICPDISDMRKGEKHDLRGVGRVCQDLFIAGDAGIEAEFADIRACCTCANAEENGAIGEGNCSRGARAGLNFGVFSHISFRLRTVFWSLTQPTEHFVRLMGLSLRIVKQTGDCGM